jgi:hypothetical protein
MALIKFGAVIVDSRGSVGGATFKMTKQGSVMQTKSNPTRKVTQSTTENRSHLASLGDKWFSTLTQAQRNAWIALALANPLPNQWGDQFPLSGVAFYVRTNLTLLAIAETQVNDAPADQAVTALGSVTLTVTAPATASLAFTPTPTTANHKLLLAAALPASPGQAPTTQKYFALMHGDAGETSPMNIATEYSARVGSFVTGKRYSIRAVQVSTVNGARSNELIATAIAS